MSAAQAQIDGSHLNSYLHEKTTLTGTIKEIEQTDEEAYKLCVEVEGEMLLCSYYHPIYHPEDLIGAEITFSAAIEKPKPAGNPRCFDYNLYLKTKKIYFVAVMDSMAITEDEPTALDRAKRFILSKREGMLDSLAVSTEVKGLVRGVLFGDTKSLDEDIYKEFQRNGTAHVLAVSGLHVGILYGVYQKLNGRRKSYLAAGIFVSLLFIYGTATLWSVSVTRAVLLILLMVFGNLTDRRYDTATALAATALAVVLYNPYAVMGASFQMSFLAVLSLTFFAPLLVKKLGGTFAVLLSVQMGLMPYMAYSFNYVSFIGLVCNIPVVFMISLFVPMGIAGYLLFMAFGTIFPLVSESLNGLGILTMKINHFFAADGTGAFDVVSPPLWIVCLLYGIMFFAASEHFHIYYKRKDFKGLAPLAATIGIMVIFSYFAGSSPFDKADIVFVDVGQGDCVHMKGDDGSSLLFDGGGSIRYNVGEKTLKPYLLKNSVGNIDLAAATHLHTDHFLGLEQLAECFDVKRLLTKGKAGQQIFLNKSQWIDILWPEKQDPEVDDENLNSLIFKIYDHGMTVLITGDITEEGERALLEKYKGTSVLKSDVLKVAHHGSAYSTSDEFLEAVKPSIAVIGVGKNNYGHPSNVVIEKLQKNGIMVFRTDQMGAVGIINRKGKISVCTKNQ